MKTYDDLALQNKHLFEELEKNSEQIAFLNTRREQLKKMINVNMESLNDLLVKKRNTENEIQAEIELQTILNNYNKNEEES